MRRMRPGSDHYSGYRHSDESSGFNGQVSNYVSSAPEHSIYTRRSVLSASAPRSPAASLVLSVPGGPRQALAIRMIADVRAATSRPSAWGRERVGCT